MARKVGALERGARNVVGVAESDKSPGLARISGAVDPCARGGVARHQRFAGSKSWVKHIVGGWQVGSVAEAKEAVDAGCDLIIAQGLEAGGHLRGAVGCYRCWPMC